MIFVTTSIDADRNGKLYPRGILPDVPINFAREEIDTPTDPVVQRAIDWIKTGH
jgi:hypothetical protein